MTTLSIYGEAQFSRALKEDHLHLVFFYDNDNKSDSIHRHLKNLESFTRRHRVQVLTISRDRLPSTYYQRRAITTFPSVAFFIGQQEVGRSTGIHTEKMLKVAIERHLAKLPPKGEFIA